MALARSRAFRINSRPLQRIVASAALLTPTHVTEVQWDMRLAPRRPWRR